MRLSLLRPDASPLDLRAPSQGCKIGNTATTQQFQQEHQINVHVDDVIMLYNSLERLHTLTLLVRFYRKVRCVVLRAGVRV